MTPKVSIFDDISELLRYLKTREQSKQIIKEIDQMQQRIAAQKKV